MSNATRLLQFFEYSHLPQYLQDVSMGYRRMADEMMGMLPDNIERDECLRKLLEAKDCAVRSAIYKGA